MIISDEQVERVLDYVRSGGVGNPRASEPRSASEELVARIRASVDAAPDVREDRLEQARVFIASGLTTSRDVASKVIARSLSDSIR